MRKLISLMLCLALTAGAALAQETGEATGAWQLNIVEYGGMAMDALIALGSDAVLILEEDGAATLNSPQEEFDAPMDEGSWRRTESGEIVLKMDGLDMSCMLREEDVLYAYSAEKKIGLIFGRERKTARIWDSPCRSGVEMEDFNGEWVAVMFCHSGLQIPAEALDARVTLRLRDGALIYEQTDAAGIEGVTFPTLDCVGAGGLEEDALAVRLAADMTGASAVLPSLRLSVAPADGEMILRLHEDGTLSDGYIPPEDAQGEYRYTVYARREGEAE